MKKFFSILCTTALITSLTGCTGEETSNPSSNSRVSLQTSNSTDNSGNSGESETSEDRNSSDSTPEPQKPAGEPTFLTAPDGTPIYTSEISEVYTESEEQGNKKTITLAKAEQMAQTGDGNFTVKCDGFVYGYIPQRALNRVDNPEMFEDIGNGGNFEYLGELSEGKAGYNKQLTDFIRIKPGDKFGELTVKNAYTLFTGNTKYLCYPYGYALRRGR